MHLSICSATAITALVFTFSVGCGELATKDTQPPPLATLRGSLRLAPGMAPPEGKLRLSLLWQIPVPEEDPDQSTRDTMTCRAATTARVMSVTNYERLLIGVAEQAVEIVPQFPSSFRLNIMAPPPAEALYQDEQGATRADGSFVVYRDGNENGRLDPRTETAPSPDEVLSTSYGQLGLLGDDPRVTMRPWDHQVWFSDRALELNQAKLKLEPGYNVIGYQNYGDSFVRLQTEVELEILPTPALQALLCTNLCLEMDRMPMECPASPAELPHWPEGSIAGFLQVGNGWVWSESSEQFVFETRQCLKTLAPEGGENYLYSFRWSRTYADGCVHRRTAYCNYGPTREPPADWPCETFVVPPGVPNR